MLAKTTKATTPHVSFSANSARRLQTTPASSHSMDSSAHNGGSSSTASRSLDSEEIVDHSGEEGWQTGSEEEFFGEDAPAEAS